ncbi:hypothetical protein [Sinisalibacter aestuarii]|uniref:Uncharacterized protein n=1 Tax=Sinisalibacter aestuarii TaxID=2949426 RepID=A0ABQ5LQ66_9RHOB|nr:hypothetical protein [Sinisalibacter aestuarii]GKY87149.1 hypothetical protein STA1M1_10180 [Sinisalibacter aestuarii]
MEFYAFSPRLPYAAAAEPGPQRADMVTKIAPSDDARGTGADSRNHTAPDERAAGLRAAAALRHEMERRGLPAGPPPAFRMNLLETEAGVSRVIARLEAARAQERDGKAVKLPDEAPAPAMPARSGATQPAAQQS